MKPFLLLQVRQEDIAARDEYQSFLSNMGLDDRHLVNIAVHDGAPIKINLDLFSGIIVGGGPPNVSSDDSDKFPNQLRMEASLMDLLDEVVSLDFPFLGVCYGHGVLAMHQGGRVAVEFSEQFGNSNITLVDAGLNDEFFLGLDKTFDAFVGHKESVIELPTNATLLATSKACPVQSFRIKHNIYAVQFHPELDQKSLTLRANVYKSSGYFPADEVESIIAKVAKTNVSQPSKVLTNFARMYGNRV